VGRATFELLANGTDVVPVTLLYPADGEGKPTVQGAPALISIQGGAVSPTRYEWQAVELARRGYVVALPRHPNDLAFFAADNGQAVRRLLVEPGGDSLLTNLVDPARIAVGGHSLGGVVALKVALGGGFAAVVVQASFQDSADDAKLKDFSKPVLFLAGRGDCQAKEAQVRAGWEKLSGPRALVLLEQVTHFQFTDSQADDEKRGCPVALPLEDAHDRVMRATSAFLDAALSATPSVGAEALATIPGSTVEVR
jgi:predicted dienelactone hydrolase